jgi:hypothetical protein
MKELIKVLSLVVGVAVASQLLLYLSGFLIGFFLRADGGTCLSQNSISTRNIALRIRVSRSPEGEIGKPDFTGPTQTPVGMVNDQATIDLGSLGILLIEMFNRIQTIDPCDTHSVEVLNYIDTNLSKLE